MAATTATYRVMVHTREEGVRPIEAWRRRCSLPAAQRVADREAARSPFTWTVTVEKRTGRDPLTRADVWAKVSEQAGRFRRAGDPAPAFEVVGEGVATADGDVQVEALVKVTSWRHGTESCTRTPLSDLADAVRALVTEDDVSEVVIHYRHGGWTKYERVGWVDGSYADPEPHRELADLAAWED